MTVQMFLPGMVRGRRAGGTLLVAVGLLATSCVSTTDADLDAGSRQQGAVDSGDRAAETNADQLGSSAGSSGADVPVAALAFDDGSVILGSAAPGGSPLRSCFIDYRTVDWSAKPDSVVAAHRAASLQPCAGHDWYRETSFQNGILSFMVLVGESRLAAAAPTSDEPSAIVESLRSQGFDRIATIETTSSGSCEHGEVQAVLITTIGDVDTDGLEAIVEAARATGATIDQRTGVTIIADKDAACAAAVIHHRDVVGWVTAADDQQLEAAIEPLLQP